MASETYLVNEDPSRGHGMPECFVVSDSYRYYPTHLLNNALVVSDDHIYSILGVFVLYSVSESFFHFCGRACSVGRLKVNKNEMYLKKATTG